ncbi:MAG TPA: PaaI family thioesterase [Myxococcota bacterium]|jgi:acyl-coenzyme A thioesterase PaaI-like protein|nr:PaaI family thioesterase [Myxococcota bacterium]
MREPYISRGCFGCGTQNEHALGLRPRVDGERLVAELSLPAFYRGFSRVVHGGISTALLDEIMGMAVGCAVEGRMATARVEVDFLKPVLVETPLRVEGWYTGTEGRYHLGEGRLLAADGTELSLGRGRFVAIGETQALAFMGRPLGTREG